MCVNILGLKKKALLIDQNHWVSDHFYHILLPFQMPLMGSDNNSHTFKNYAGETQ